MEKITGKLTVFFDDPFWVGVFERIEENKLSVCRVVFGAEPKDYEVYDFILKNYSNLKFSSSIEVEVKKGNANPKRLQREARKQVKQVGIGTKSQLALQQQREEMKLERKTKIRQRRELEKQRKFELKQEKRKQKHRGK
ncbi:YjdF family protein [Peptostreptococcus sp.]|jgi:hypothetical protein|uniref:YjdF family protein n=1 Tax=Peptostreptococcus sp. TaxID=1262 RepID=UPI001CB3A077|nr:YjdF family protein [Peptostreptococcus sp.]MBF1050175.1 YjdF family protein [Peptostreptococcus sp.]